MPKQDSGEDGWERILRAKSNVIFSGGWRIRLQHCNVTKTTGVMWIWEKNEALRICWEVCVVALSQFLSTVEKCYWCQWLERFLSFCKICEWSTERLGSGHWNTCRWHENSCVWAVLYQPVRSTVGQSSGAGGDTLCKLMNLFSLSLMILIYPLFHSQSTLIKSQKSISIFSPSYKNGYWLGSSHQTHPLMPYSSLYLPANQKGLTWRSNPSDLLLGMYKICTCWGS